MPQKPKTNAKYTKEKSLSGFDVCQTPPHAIEPLLPYLSKDWIIWESACGPEKLLIDAFEAHDFTVIYSDILHGDQYDFFRWTPVGKWDIQITNPPFSLKYQWLQRSFELGRKFALLVPYETTFAAKFQTLFKQYNARPYEIEVLSPARRIDYKMQQKGWSGKGAQMPTCWIGWGLGVAYCRNDFLKTFYVPMRKVRYSEDNAPI